MTMNDYDRVTIGIDKDLHRDLTEAKPYGETLKQFTERLLMEALDDVDR
jgi:hypothetical protein